MTPPGIEPATFRFVAQHLNHCATAVPYDPYKYIKTNLKEAGWGGVDRTELARDRNMWRTVVRQVVNCRLT